jgi:hypothetical protein
MTPLERQIVDSNFEKNAGAMEYVRKAPAYLKSLFTREALRQAKTIGFSYPGQIKQGPIDLYRLGLKEGGKAIKDRLLKVNLDNPQGAPITFLAPKIIIPAGLAALGLGGDSEDTPKVVDEV